MLTFVTNHQKTLVILVGWGCLLWAVFVIITSQPDHDLFLSTASFNEAKQNLSSNNEEIHKEQRGTRKKMTSSDNLVPSARHNQTNVTSLAYVNRAVVDRRFVINNPLLCKRVPSLKVFVLVMIRVNNSDARKYFRDRWLNPNLYKDPPFVAGYMVGMTKRKEDQERLVEEARMFGDIIQGDFVDSYRNGSLKIIGALKWIGEYCQEATYIIKVDEDVFLDIVRILEYMENNTLPENVISCCPVGGMVQRSRKFAVSRLDYPNTRYPTYCCGPVYMFHRNIAEKLYAQASVTRTIIWIEDAFVTGILKEKIADVSFGAKKHSICKWWKDRGTLEEYTNCTRQIIHYIAHRNDHKFHRDFDIMWQAGIQRLPAHVKAKLNNTVLAETSKLSLPCSN